MGYIIWPSVLGQIRVCVCVASGQGKSKCQVFKGSSVRNSKATVSTAEIPRTVPGDERRENRQSHWAPCIRWQGKSVSVQGRDPGAEVVDGPPPAGWRHMGEQVLKQGVGRPL